MPDTDDIPILSKNYWALLMLGAALGGLIGAVAGSFLWAQHYLIEWLWESIPSRLDGNEAIYLFLLPVIGGVAVGLGRKYLGDHPQPMRVIMERMKRGEKLPGISSAPTGYLLSLISLGFGASLGPEAALAGVTVGLGSWARDVLADMRHTLRLDDATKPWSQAPGGIAILAGFVVFALVAKPMFNLSYTFIDYRFRLSIRDMLLAVVLGLVGALLGWLFVKSGSLLRWMLRPVQDHAVALGVIGGVFLGLMGAISPFILFSGQVGLSQLFVQNVDLGGFFLILIGLLKLLTTKVNIVTGWKGGEIFPMMFATAAIGVGVSMIFPAVPTMIAVAAIMSAAITIELENMLVSLAILAIFLPLNLALTMIIAGLVATATMRKNPINFKFIRRTVRQPEAS